MLTKHPVKVAGRELSGWPGQAGSHMTRHSRSCKSMRGDVSYIRPAIGGHSSFYLPGPIDHKFLAHNHVLQHQITVIVTSMKQAVVARWNERKKEKKRRGIATIKRDFWKSPMAIGGNWSSRYMVSNKTSEASKSRCLHCERRWTRDSQQWKLHSRTK